MQCAPPQLCWKQRSNIPASHGFGFYYVYTDGNVRHLSRLRFQNQASAEETHFFPNHSVPGGCLIYIGLNISGHILVNQMYPMHLLVIFWSVKRTLCIFRLIRGRHINVKKVTSSEYSDYFH